MKKILSILLILGLIGAFVGYRMYNKPHKDMAKAKADLVLDAKQFLSDYKANEEASNAKFLDKVVAVNGTVKNITNEEGNMKIILAGNDDMEEVTCELDSEIKPAKTYAVGQPAAFKGSCTGYMMGTVILTRCVEAN